MNQILSLSIGLMVLLNSSQTHATAPTGTPQPTPSLSQRPSSPATINSTLSPQPSPPSISQKVNLQVSVNSIRSSEGKVLAYLYSSSEGFPIDSKKAFQVLSTSAQTQGVTFNWSGLTPGEYAITVIHDQNSNDRMDTNFIGIPSEGIGVSRDAKGRMGPPSFDDAKLKLSQPKEIHSIQMKYL